MRGHFLAVGNQVDDLHREVGEGVAEGCDPAACHQGKLALGYLVQYIRVAGIDSVLD